MAKKKFKFKWGTGAYTKSSLQRKLAGKLLADGMQPSNYSKAKAKRVVKNVVAPVLMRNVINHSKSSEIVALMKKIKSKS